MQVFNHSGDVIIGVLILVICTPGQPPHASALDLHKKFLNENSQRIAERNPPNVSLFPDHWHIQKLNLAPLNIGPKDQADLDLARSNQFANSAIHIVQFDEKTACHDVQALFTVTHSFLNARRALGRAIHHPAFGYSKLRASRQAMKPLVDRYDELLNISPLKDEHSQSINHPGSGATWPGRLNDIHALLTRFFKLTGREEIRAVDIGLGGPAGVRNDSGITTIELGKALTGEGPRVVHLTGIDINFSYVESAVKSLHQAALPPDLRISFQPMQNLNLCPFAPLDLVTIFNVHIYLEQSQFREWLRTISRGLSESGIIVATTDSNLFQETNFLYPGREGNLGNLLVYDRELKRIDSRLLYSHLF